MAATVSQAIRCRCRIRRALRATPQISEALVPRANPGRAHVGVALAMRPKQGERQSVCYESRDADGTHCNGARERAVQGMPDHRSDDPKAERAHCETIEHGSGGAIAERHSDHQKAYRIICRITEEVERIRLQRRRSAANPAPISTRNIAAFMVSTAQRALR